ncbi:LysR substrate-binding domain-containing protein [Lactobacillus taiwanensis]|uniref:LysR substrate-binding domain-containing protein n=1 Tax=Lactobacillus taiwanensis TaxID=508451 RepID=UPI0024301C7D|nr:LysR substrate-binding domain-containing protein [Lactobacillus taiwanensis]
MTPVGQYFYQHGQDLLANYNLLIDQTKQIGEREKDNYTLKLGYLRDFDTSEFLQAVTEFSKKYPEVKVRIHSGNREELFRLLRDDRIDLNFSDLRRAPSNKYVNEYLTSSSFEIVINKRLVRGSKKITSHELAEFPYILIVGNSEKDSELEYCRTVLGIESNFKLVETYDEALMQVISGADIF